MPDIECALTEIRRVLKETGRFIFTIPLVPTQKITRRRAYMDGGKIVHLEEPSYHGNLENGKDDYIVFYEFGKDFIDVCSRTGFEVELVRDSRNPAIIAIHAKPA